MLKFSRNFSTLTERTVGHLRNTNDKFNSKIKGTIFEKWVKYWKLVARDYKDVVVSVQQEMINKPVKSTFIATGLGSVAFCSSNNPNLQSFRAKYVQCSNDLAMVSPDVVNLDSVKHLKYIEQSFNANLIRYMNLGVFSIVWVDKFSDQCDTYESNCSYCQVQYKKFTERVLDVGFLNIWWITSRKMLDYDVNI